MVEKELRNSRRKAEIEKNEKNVDKTKKCGIIKTREQKLFASIPPLGG